MKVIVVMFFIHSVAVNAQGVEGRLNAAKKIMRIYQEHCEAKSEKIKEAFELSEIYMIHGEYNNMKEQMLKAKSISKNIDCHKSIDKYLN
jgi:hypothetical protein